MEDYSKLTSVLLKLRKQLNYNKLEPLFEELKDARSNTNFDDPKWSFEEWEEFYFDLEHISFSLRMANNGIAHALEVIEKHKKYNELIAKKKDINYIKAKLKELGLELNTPPPRF